MIKIKKIKIFLINVGISKPGDMAVIMTTMLPGFLILLNFKRAYIMYDISILVEVYVMISTNDIICNNIMNIMKQNNKKYDELADYLGISKRPIQLIPSLEKRIQRKQKRGLQ